MGGRNEGGLGAGGGGVHVRSPLQKEKLPTDEQTYCTFLPNT